MQVKKHPTETQARRHQNSKRGVSVVQQEGLMSSEIERKLAIFADWPIRPFVSYSMCK